MGTLFRYLFIQNSTKYYLVLLFNQNPLQFTHWRKGSQITFLLVLNKMLIIPGKVFLLIVRLKILISEKKIAPSI